MPAPLITMPTSACIATVALSMTRVVGVTQSPFTKEEQFFKWEGEQWALEFTLPPIINKIVAAQWRAFGLKCDGGYAQFLIGDPSAKTPLGVATGTPNIDGSGQEGNILNTKGWAPNVTGILKVGDYIQVGEGEDSRLHMLVEDASSGPDGKAPLSIMPALRQSPLNNSTIITENARGVFRMLDNTFSWSVRQGGVHQFGFRAQEVINA